MFGGVATICPECSNQWTLSPLVSISWACPKCGGSRNNETFAYPCACGHLYQQHYTTQDVKPSRAAFGISLAELDKVDEILATEPELPPTTGCCGVCACGRFQLEPLPFPPVEFIERVARGAARGTIGRETTVTKAAGDLAEFAKRARTVRLSAQPDGSVLMETLGADHAAPRTLHTDRDSVGQTVIAIRDSLR